MKVMMDFLSKSWWVGICAIATIIGIISTILLDQRHRKPQPSRKPFLIAAKPINWTKLSTIFTALCFITTIVSIIVAVKTTSPTSSNPSGNIEEIWQEHDVFENNRRGMKIYINFSVSNMLNKEGFCSVYFYYLNGAPLKDYDNMYVTSDGNVAVYRTYKSDYKISYYNYVLFMPYDELHLKPGFYDLEFFVEIADDDWNRIAISKYFSFPYIEKIYTITFNANGGIFSGGVTTPTQSFTQTEATNGKALFDGIPTRNGYIFICWNSEQDGSGKSFLSGSNITVSSSGTLYAVWGAVPPLLPRP